MLPTYLVVVSLVYCLCIVWAWRRAIEKDLDVTTGLDLTLVLMLGGFLGARLFHVFYEEPAFYMQNPAEIFKIWQGGFVFLGGAFVAVIFAALWCQWRKIDFWLWADFFAPVTAIGYGLGRLACFLNGCCYGVYCQFPWGVTFPSHLGRGLEMIPRHPTQLYACFWELGVGILLLHIQSRDIRFFRRPGRLFMFWIVLHSLGRIMMEHFRADFRGPIVFGFSISSWLSLMLLSMSSLWLWLDRSSKKKRSKK